MAVIKSNKDTRYGLDSIVTHDGMKLPCWALANLSSFRQKLGRDAYDQVCIFLPSFASVTGLYGYLLSNLLKNDSLLVTA